MKGIFRNILPALAALFFLAGCLGLFESQKVAGNGSEVENAIVAGRVVSPDGSSAPDVDVTLYLPDYDAMMGKPVDPAYKAKTDTGGRFQLKVAPETAWNVWGHRRADGTRFLLQRLEPFEKGARHLDAGVSMLRKPGSLRVTLPEASGEGGYVFVPGTPMALSVDGAADSNGTLLIDSIPAGTLKSVLLGRPGKPGQFRTLGTNVVINPGETTNLPYTEWAYSASLRLNAAGLVSKGVANIPLLLRLSRAEFDFSQAKGDGSDVRFTRENGTILPCRVQLWDSLEATAAVWIKVDTVAADTGAQRLRMYWGNARATSPATKGAAKSALFDTADGYVGAWHLDAALAGAVPAFPDASPAANSARGMGILSKPDSMSPIGPADGRIGGGVPLNGKDSWLMSTREYAGPAAFTASFWFRTTSKEGGKMLGFVMPGLKGVSYGSKTGNFNFDRVVWMTDEGLLHAGFTMRSTSYPTIIGSWQSFTAAKAYNDGQWHHLSYTLGNSGALLMVDGEKAASYTGLVRPLPDAGHWRVGYAGDGKWDPEWTSEYFQGSVDEVRLSHRARNEDWLRLEYASQKAGSTLLTLERD